MFNRDPFRVMSPLRYAVTLGLGIAFNLAVWSGVHSQIVNPGAQISGAVTSGHCAKFGPGLGQIQDAGVAGCGGAYTASALNSANDTNVTVTLSGTPASALLQTVTMTMGWTGTLAAARLNSNVVQGVTNDTNITGSISAQNLTLGWSGVLAAARLNSNVVQGVTNDTNVQGSISAQNLTLAWAGQLAIARGGTGAATQGAAAINIFPSPTRAGDIVYWNGTAWVTLAGNNSGTQVLSENSSGVPSWTSAGTGTLTGITGGTGISVSGSAPSPTVNLALTNATLQGSPSAPSGVGSTAVMLGLGSTCHITPTYDGRITVTFDGSLSNSASASGTMSTLLRYGTGTAPVNGAAVTGTSVGAAQATNVTAIGNFVPFSITRTITGLTQGTAYWLDLSYSASAGTGTMTDVNCSGSELGG